MKKKYIDIPLFTTLDEIVNKNYTLSATQYKSFNIPNKNIKPLSDFLDLELSSQMQRYIKINFKRRFPVQAFAWTLI